MDNFKEFVIDGDVSINLENITNELFEIVEFVLLKEPELIGKLERIYSEINKKNVSTIKNLTNRDGITLLDYYQSLPDFDNTDLQNHKSKFISSLKQVSGMLSLFEKPRERINVPTNLELLSKLEEKDKKIAELETVYMAKLEDIELRLNKKKCAGCVIL